MSQGEFQLLEAAGGHEALGGQRGAGQGPDGQTAGQTGRHVGVDRERREGGNVLSSETSWVPFVPRVRMAIVVRAVEGHAVGHVGGGAAAAVTRVMAFLSGVRARKLQEKQYIAAHVIRNVAVAGKNLNLRKFLQLLPNRRSFRQLCASELVRHGLGESRGSCKKAGDKERKERKDRTTDLAQLFFLLSLFLSGRVASHS